MAFMDGVFFAATGGFVSIPCRFLIISAAYTN